MTWGQRWQWGGSIHSLPHRPQAGPACIWSTAAHHPASESQGKYVLMTQRSREQQLSCRNKKIFDRNCPGKLCDFFEVERGHLKCPCCRQEWGRYFQQETLMKVLGFIQQPLSWVMQVADTNVILQLTLRSQCSKMDKVQPLLSGRSILHRRYIQDENSWEKVNTETK